MLAVFVINLRGGTHRQYISTHLLMCSLITLVPSVQLLRIAREYAVHDEPGFEALYAHVRVSGGDPKMNTAF